MIDDSDAKAAFGIVVGTAIIALLFYAAVLAIPLAAVGFGGWLIHYQMNKSPRAMEKKAREHTHALYLEAKQRYPIHTPEDFAIAVLDRLPELPVGIGVAIAEVSAALFRLEHFQSIPEPPLVCNSIEGARYRDLLSRLTSQDVTHAADIVANSMNAFAANVPATGDGTLAVVPEPDPQAILETIVPFYNDEGYFTQLKSVLDQNLREVSGIPDHIRNSPDLIMPPDYKGENIQYAYLKDTPLLELFDMGFPFSLPEKSRYEHCHICSGTGGGKTTLLQHLILADLKSDKSVVVLDSQGELIPQLAKLKLDRNVILLDPRDNPTLNVFDIGLSGEQVYNQTLEVFTYLFNSLLGADLTTKQEALFNYTIALMLKLPEAMGRNATLLDIMHLMDDPTPYASAVEALDDIPRTFFQKDFVEGTTYKQTKDQIRYRLQAILGKKPLARLFLAPKNTVNFYEELNNGSVILIDTSKAFLAKTQSAYMGKVAIALVLNAIVMRTGNYHPTMVYVDEVAEYFSKEDSKIDEFLTEARKRMAGITFAHQNLTQVRSAELRDSIAANTSIKIASRLSNRDARALAHDMRTTPDFLLSQPKLQFACYIKDHGIQSVRVPLGILDKEEQMTDEEYQAFREANRARVTSSLPQPEPPVAPDGSDDPTTGAGDWL